MHDSLHITNKTKSTLHRVPFLAIKNAVMGKEYELSLVFVGTRRSRKLNNSYRQKDKPTNILSFILDTESGEIFITPKVAEKEAKKFDRSYTNFIAFLFIHGLFHLKGLDHGTIMETAEEKIRKQFGI